MKLPLVDCHTDGISKVSPEQNHLGCRCCSHGALDSASCSLAVGSGSRVEATLDGHHRAASATRLAGYKHKACARVSIEQGIQTVALGLSTLHILSVVLDQQRLDGVCFHGPNFPDSTAKNDKLTNFTFMTK